MTDYEICADCIYGDQPKWNDGGTLVWSCLDVEKMNTTKVPKQLDAITETVLAYRPRARSKPAVQRKRRKTILDKKRAAERK